MPEMLTNTAQKKHLIQILRLAATLISLVFAGCKYSPPEYIYSPPIDLEDGLIVGTIGEVGLTLDPLGRAIDRIRDGKFGEVHSILVYKDGLLVVEEYFPGHDYDWGSPNFHGAWVQWNEKRQHNIHSVGKSITSACVGIAIKQGMITSLDDPIFDYLPDYQDQKQGGKGQITIEHLLTMTSGLGWDEWGTSYSSEENDVIRLYLECQDPIVCILEKPLIHDPGSTFNYSGGDMILLGRIVENASGIDIENFSWEYLFRPMGINDPPWNWITDTVINAGGDQLLTPRDMLKFGILYLNDGAWKDQKIIPEYWSERSSMPYGSNTRIEVPGVDGGPKGYGYTWWTDELRIKGNNIPVFFGLGFGDQRIYVLPDLEAVVVFTGGNYISSDPSLGILRDYILPAMME